MFNDNKFENLWICCWEAFSARSTNTVSLSKTRHKAFSAEYWEQTTEGIQQRKGGS